MALATSVLPRSNRLVRTVIVSFASGPVPRLDDLRGAQPQPAQPTMAERRVGVEGEVG